MKIFFILFSPFLLFSFDKVLPVCENEKDFKPIYTIDVTYLKCFNRFNEIRNDINWKGTDEGQLNTCDYDFYFKRVDNCISIKSINKNYYCDLTFLGIKMGGKEYTKTITLNIQLNNNNEHIIEDGFDINDFFNTENVIFHTVEPIQYNCHPKQ